MLNIALVFIPEHIRCIELSGCRPELSISALIASSLADHCKFYIFGVRFAYFDRQYHSCGFVLSLLSGTETQVQIPPYFEVRMFPGALLVHLFTRALAEANGKQTQIKHIQ